MIEYEDDVELIESDFSKKYEKDLDTNYIDYGDLK